MKLSRLAVQIHGEVIEDFVLDDLYFVVRWSNGEAIAIEMSEKPAKINELWQDDPSPLATVLFLLTKVKNLEDKDRVVTHLKRFVFDQVADRYNDRVIQVE